MVISVLDRVENIVGKEENAGYQHFLLFPQCFQKPSFIRVVKSQDSVVTSYVKIIEDILNLPFRQNPRNWDLISSLPSINDFPDTEPKWLKVPSEILAVRMIDSSSVSTDSCSTWNQFNSFLSKIRQSDPYTERRIF